MVFRRVRPTDGPEAKIRFDFRLNLRNRRLQLGMSQRELAERVGVDPRWIQQLEHPRPGKRYPEPCLQELERIAAELGVAAWDLISPGKYCGLVTGDMDLRKTQWRAR